MLERSDAITRLKCFRYAFISRSAGGSNGSNHGGAGGEAASDSIFGRPNVLTRLAHFLIDVQACNFGHFFEILLYSQHMIVQRVCLQRSNGAWAGRKAKPLILAAEKRNTFLVIGVVPATAEVSKLNMYPIQLMSVICSMPTADFVVFLFCLFRSWKKASLQANFVIILRWQQTRQRHCTEAMVCHDRSFSLFVLLHLF
jgi:hypothetical protein